MNLQGELQLKKKNNRRTDRKTPAPKEFPMRVSKFLAGAGVASRRKAEELITEGRIKVNGKQVLEQGTKINEEDDVTFDGKKVTLNKDKCYIMLNKPPGFVCTNSDPYADKTVYDLVNVPGRRLFSVGRLDANSEGLLIITDDGNLAEKIMHPRFEVKKKYLVVTASPLPENAEKKILKGIYNDGEILRAESVLRLKRKCEYIFTMKEGKKREIRRIISSLDGKVKILRRLAIGSLQLGTLPKGSWKYLTPADIKKIFENKKK
jgi:pseudouridine synthase